MLPALGFGFLVISGVVAILVTRLRGSYQRLRESEARAQHASRHDALTGLPNRAYFEERLTEALKNATVAPVALLFLDLDRFKQVNDTLGHPAGDLLIQTFGRRLAKQLGPDQFLARLGGDEFAVIVPRGNQLQRIEALCAAIQTAACTPFWLSTAQALVAASIGIAVAEKGERATDLTRKADIALYQAKNAGRSRHAFFSDETGTAMSKRRVLEVELRTAIKTCQGLGVVYQPVYRASSLEMWGAEALVRWDNPRVGPVSPLEFISIAEDCGLIEPLGTWVLRQACAVAVEVGLANIAVNASAAQFLNPGFADLVLSILDEAGLAPERLEIELTERTLLEASVAAKESMTLLRRKGVKIALDDFGTGYSSLSYLMQHKVDRLKIDRSFTNLIEQGGPAASIVLAMTSMAHAMEIEVTAEGVETEEQLALLKLLGCDSLQGYHLSQPLSVSQLRMLKQTVAIA